MDSTSSETREPVVTNYAWFVVGALALANMMSMVERQLLTLLFEPIKQDFSLNDTQVSLLSGFAFVIFYVAFGLYVGRLADRANRKWIISIGILAWTLATMLCGLAKNFVQLFIARMAVGVGEATLSPSALSMISDYFPRRRLARANSFYYFASYAGAGFALVAGGAVIHLVSTLPLLTIPGIGTLAHWQTTFLIAGAVGMLVLIPMMFVREPTRHGVIALSGTDNRKSNIVSVKDVAQFIRKNWQVYAFIFPASSLMALLGVGTMTWVPTYLMRIYGWEPHDVGYYYGLSLSLIGGGAVIAGAWVTEWMERRGYRDAHARLPMFAMSLAAVSTLIAIAVPDGNISLIFIVGGTLFLALNTAANAAVFQLVTPNQMRGQVMALHIFLNNMVGPALGPVIIGALTDYVYQDKMAVGYSIATIWICITPVIVLLVLWGLPHYRRSLDQAETWGRVGG